ASPTGHLGFLQSTVVREALEHRRSHDWSETVPTWALRLAKLGHAGALAFLLVVLTALVYQANTSVYGHNRPGAPVDRSELQVDPGDPELEGGTPLLVVARFNRSVPADANLVVTAAGGRSTRRAMTRSLEDPTFAGHVESVETDLTYRVEFEGRSTET